MLRIVGKVQRKRYDASFKTRVVLEVLKEQKTLAQLSHEYGVHATQIGVRQWVYRTVLAKFECVYLHPFENGRELYKSLENYIQFYNFERKHQSLNYLTPAQVYIENKKAFS